jgi:hypothetical protein
MKWSIKIFGQLHTNHDENFMQNSPESNSVQAIWQIKNNKKYTHEKYFF